MKKTKIFLSLTIVVLLIFSFAACNKNETTVEEDPKETTETTDTEKPDDSTTASTTASDVSQTINTIVADAKEGKVINCSVTAQSSIDDVKNEWGEPNSDTFVSDAKGSYADFSNYGVVFGYNKGDQIFELRRFMSSDADLDKITLKDVKATMGNPAYTANDVNGKPIVGYQVSGDYKLLFVMTEGGDDSKIDHYNVLWPQGSSDLMAGDMGKAW